MGNLKNTPKLRFPEFTEEWEKKKLKDTIQNLDSGVSVKSFDEPVNDSSEFGILKTSCVVAGRFYPEQNKKILDDEVSRAKLNPIADRILISRMNTPQLVGECGYISRDYPNLFIPDRLWLAKTNENTNAKLLSVILSSKKVMSNISNIATGTSGSMKNISQPNFLNIETCLPLLMEQTKIADFLFAVDEKFQAFKKKKSLLEEYKKGVMQKLFSRKIRLKNEKGMVFQEWSKRKLGKVLIKNSTKNKEHKFTLVQSVSNKHGFINQDEYFEDRRVASKETSNYYVIKKGHFAYNPSRIDVGSLAYKSDSETSIVSPLYVSFNANNNVLFDGFLLNWFSSEQFSKQMNSSFEGSVRNTLSYESLVKMDILLPCKDEQFKIGTFLTSIDNKIKLSELEIIDFENWKKGLLQKMFC
jgi:type I restriction enzyme, S subunit